MKKMICFLLAAAMACGLLTGCFLFNEGVAPAPSETSLPLPENEPQQPDSQAGEPVSEAPPAPETFTLVVPEGYTLARIAMTLEEAGVCTKEEFIEATQTGDFSAYSLMAAQQPNEHRCFDLEGYLFPATYELSKTAAPEDIIRQMLEATEQRLGGDIRTRIDQSGFTAEEILTLASIIEKESYGAESMGLISSVLHNRLNIDMQLQCDVTINYVEGAIKPFIDGDVDRYNEYYNTYKCPALPAGPICNPGMAAIEAALSPVETNYIYFLTDDANAFYFAETWEEHEANVAAVGLDD